MKHVGFFIYFLFSCGLINCPALQAQTSQSLPLSITLMDESPSLGNHWFLSFPYHPAARVGTEHILRKFTYSDIYLAPNLGFWYDPRNEVGVHLNLDLGYRYRYGRWFITPRVGAGFLYRVILVPQYELKQGLNALEETSSSGLPYLMVAATVKIGLQLRKEEYAPELYLNLTQSFQAPFNFYSGYHQLVGIGLQFYPFKDSENR